MALESKRGTGWESDELDLIVSDYFEMLLADLSGQPYVKSRHSAALMAKIERTHRSVEFKHQNISAVLDELGMPWIPGYKPKPIYQNAIFDAIDRYLSTHTSLLEYAPNLSTIRSVSIDVFVQPPVARTNKEPGPKRLRQLVQKFDPVRRDHLNRALGQAGEGFVVEVEKCRLAKGNRPDLAEKVRWTSVEDGDGAGYDVSSFHLQGKPRLIEVKTTNGSATTPFFLTRNEWAVAHAHDEDWLIYRVHQFANNPRIFTISPPLEETLKLAPETWRASF